MTMTTQHVTSENSKWGTPTNMLKDRISDLDQYVLIGKNRDGSTVAFGSGDEGQSRKLFQNAAPESFVVGGSDGS